MEKQQVFKSSKQLSRIRTHIECMTKVTSLFLARAKPEPVLQNKNYKDNASPFLQRNSSEFLF
jgi:hypothetical protein